MFRRDISFPVQVTISQDDTAGDTARLSKEIWENLAVSTTQVARFAVTISPLTDESIWASESSQKSLTCWCNLDDNVSGLVLPKSYETRDPTFRSSHETSSRKHKATHRLRLASPAPLSSIAILAGSSFAYHAYATHASKVQSHVFKTEDILHVGQTLASSQQMEKLCLEECPETTGLLQYTVVAAEPAEGFFQDGFTKLIVIGSEHAISQGQPLSEEENDSLDENVLIDEHFLATSLSGTSFPFDANSASEANQQNEVTQYTPEAIWDYSAISTSDTSIYVGTQDLGELGLLSGDWAVTRPLNQSQSRLVRVIGFNSFHKPSKTCLVPRILLHNLVKPSLSPHTQKIQLLASLYGSRKPPIPLAQSITIARVASPISITRIYEASFHRSLQQYFQTDARLVKKGDIIAVSIDPMERLGTGGIDAEPKSGYENEKSTTVDELPISPRNPDTPVYFAVTNVEHDVAHSANAIATRDQYLDATVGELGCWVDPEVTRIVQEGVEHARPPTLASVKGQNAIDADQSFNTLYHLVAASLSRRAADFHLPLTVLLEGGRGIGKLTRVAAVAHTLGLHLMEANCYDVIGESAVQTEAILQTRFDNACACSPCILVLRHLHAFNQSSQNNASQSVSEMLLRCMEKLRENWLATTYPVVVIATTSAPDQIPVQTLALFKHRVVFESPADEERRGILETLLKRATLQKDISLNELATETAAFLAGDLFDLVLSATNASARRLLSQRLLSSTSNELVLASEDFTQALKSARASFSESIGAPQIPAVSWDDVGGLASVKENILDTIQLPLEHPELFSGGLKKRSGILLYGPPGTGKTLLAKAVATSFALNFFSVKGPELLNMYIGESEANVRRVFQRAKDARPCVIFFDELDSIAPKRGNHGDSGGVMDRIVSQLLAELDGVASGAAGSDIFVIGATNRPDLLDPALLRPGRFDRLLYLGVSETKAAQLDILRALTRKFKLHPDLRLELVAEACTFNFTGADFYALCADALLKAMSRKAAEIDERIARLNETRELESQPYPLTPQYYLAELATPSEIDVLVTQEDFDGALRGLVPSVSPAEMEHYRRVQRQFSTPDDIDSGKGKGKGKQRE